MHTLILFHFAHNFCYSITAILQTIKWWSDLTTKWSLTMNNSGYLWLRNSRIPIMLRRFQLKRHYATSPLRSRVTNSLTVYFSKRWNKIREYNSVPRVGLEAQLLAIVVRKEKPQLEEQKDNLVLTIASDKRTLKELQDKIL